MHFSQMLPAIASPGVMFFSESRYADGQPPKRHRGPIFGMVGTQPFGLATALI